MSFQEALFGEESPPEGMSWRLRARWHAREPVELHLSVRCTPRVVQGKVRRVSPTGALAIVGRLEVPIDEVERLV